MLPHPPNSKNCSCSRVDNSHILRELCKWWYKHQSLHNGAPWETFQFCLIGNWKFYLGGHFPRWPPLEHHWLSNEPIPGQILPDFNDLGVDFYVFEGAEFINIVYLRIILFCGSHFQRWLPNQLNRLAHVPIPCYILHDFNHLSVYFYVFEGAGLIQITYLRQLFFYGGHFPRWPPQGIFRNKLIYLFDTKYYPILMILVSISMFLRVLKSLRLLISS